MSQLPASVLQRWPARDPHRLQLYSLPTPNGVKVSIFLEETGLPYEAHRVEFERQDQFSAEFLGTFPNNKIPAILDPNGPDGQPLALFESGAILVYLADKLAADPAYAGPVLLPPGGAQRYEALQWLMWQMGGVGPNFGQVGFFHFFAGKDIEDKRPRDRFVAESARLLKVLDQHLQGREWMLGQDYSIADIATFPWVRNLVHRYGAGELVGWGQYTQVERVLQAFLARPAVQRGLTVPAA
jgi:GSH-dependent disulfide-bond oxidoreductase